MRLRRVAASAALAAVAATGCADARTAAPACDDVARLGIVAQAVPGASFVPCVGALPAGWEVTSFEVRRGRAELALRSDREDHPVEILFDRSCDVGDATAVEPRNDGVRTYVRLDDIAPRFAGAMLDVFPGGCVRYSFDFERGPHISLVDELKEAVTLASRREVRQALREELGVTIDR